MPDHWPFVVTWHWTTRCLVCGHVRVQLLPDGEHPDDYGEGSCVECDSDTVLWTKRPA